MTTELQNRAPSKLTRRKGSLLEALQLQAEHTITLKIKNVEVVADVAAVIITA